MPSLSSIAILGCSKKQCVFQSGNPRMWFDTRLRRILIPKRDTRYSCKGILREIEASAKEYLEIISYVAPLLEYKGKGRKNGCTPEELSEWLDVFFTGNDTVTSIVGKYVDVFLARVKKVGGENWERKNFGKFSKELDIMVAPRWVNRTCVKPPQLAKK
jgi:hypothetical protein